MSLCRKHASQDRGQEIKRLAPPMWNGGRGDRNAGFHFTITGCATFTFYVLTWSSLICNKYSIMAHLVVWHV